MGIEIKKTDIDSGGMGDFHQLPLMIYRDDPFYAAPLIDSVKKSIERESFVSGQKVFIAFEDGRPAARLICSISSDLKDLRSRPLGMLGFFEAFNSPDAVGGILEGALLWLEEMGAGDVIGPINGDTWHGYRFNAGPFDTAPFLMEPYNKPYYCGLWEENGFVLISEYYSKYIPDSSGILDRTRRYYERLERRGYSFRNFNVGEFEDEIRIIYRISRSVFADNYLYADIPEQNFIEMYSWAKSIVDPGLIWFALDPKGDYAGFVFTFPDYFRTKREADTLNVKTLGVLPGHRGNGLAMALMHKAYSSGLEAGFPKVNLCLIREGNPSGKVDMGAGKVSRKYRLYKYSG